MTFSIKKAENKDLTEIVNLERASFSDSWSEKTIGESLLNSNYSYFVLEDNGVICGYFCVLHVEDDFELLRITVKNEFRGKGYGTAMMTKLKDFSKESGASKIFLEVRTTNLPAKKLYEKSGFKKFSVRRNYYDGVEDADLYLCELGGE